MKNKYLKEAVIRDLYTNQSVIKYTSLHHFDVPVRSCRASVYVSVNIHCVQSLFLSESNILHLRPISMQNGSEISKLGGKKYAQFDNDGKRSWKKITRANSKHRPQSSAHASSGPHSRSVAVKKNTFHSLREG